MDTLPLTTSAAVTTTDAAEQPLLTRVIEQTPAPRQTVDGIAIGILDAFTAEGTALVSIPALAVSAVPAHCVVPLDPSHLGEAVALGFEMNDPRRPIILGRLFSPVLSAPGPEPEAETGVEAVVDGNRVRIEAEHEIELRCGQAAIILSADGRIHLRAKNITSHASASQRILGGSVNVN